jgi:hypothetical protein
MDLPTNDRQYWKQQLARAPEFLELPADYPWPELQTYEGSSSAILLFKQLIPDLTAFGRAEQAALFLVVRATFNVLLHAHTGLEYIIVGVPAAKRDCVKTMLREPNVQTIAEKLRNTARRIANDSQAIDPKLKTHPH